MSKTIQVFVSAYATSRGILVLDGTPALISGTAYFRAYHSSFPNGITLFREGTGAFRTLDEAKADAGKRFASKLAAAERALRKSSADAARFAAGEGLVHDLTGGGPKTTLSAGAMQWGACAPFPKPAAKEMK